MDPVLLVMIGVLGYLLIGAVTARVMWRVNHATIDGPGDTAGAVLGWPIVLAAFAATCAADGVHQLVTRPTKPERLTQQHEVLQRRIRQLERDLHIDEPADPGRHQSDSRDDTTDVRDEIGRTG